MMLEKVTVNNFALRYFPGEYFGGIIPLSRRNWTSFTAKVNHCIGHRATLKMTLCPTKCICQKE